MFFVVAIEFVFSYYIHFFRMAFKKLKYVDIERFLACDPPSGSEFSDLSDDDVEITDEHLCLLFLSIRCIQFSDYEKNYFSR